MYDVLVGLSNGTNAEHVEVLTNVTHKLLSLVTHEAYQLTYVLV